MNQQYIPPIMVESTSPASKLDTQIFRNVFNASPIGIAIETLKGQPRFCESRFLFDARLQREGDAKETLR